MTNSVFERTQATLWLKRRGGALTKTEFRRIVKLEREKKYTHDDYGHPVYVGARPRLSQAEAMRAHFGDIF